MSKIASNVPSRRTMLCGGVALASATMAAGAAALPATDPVFPALDAVSAARAAVQSACDHLDALEEQHGELVMYRPRVQVATLVALCVEDGQPGREEPVYAYSERDIECSYFGPDRAAKIVARTQELQADIARHHAEEKAVGLTDVRDALARALERMRAAEKAALATRPATVAVAAALAVFAADYLKEESDGEHAVAHALRHIATVMRAGVGA